MKYYYRTLFFCALFLPASVFASVKINEVAWMGTAASQYSEWIELHNDGTDGVSLDGWKIYKTGNTLLYTLSKTISAGGYLLIERTTSSAPDAVSGIDDEAGPFGGAGLRNTGEDLTLVDQNGNPINILPFANGWPAGDAKTKDTMQWDGTKWITAPGTPDAPNATTADTTLPVTTQTTAVQTVTVAPPVVVSTQPAVVTPPVNTTVTATPVVTPVVVTPSVQNQSAVVAVIPATISAQPQSSASLTVTKTTKASTAKSVPKNTFSSDASGADALEDTAAVNTQTDSAEALADTKENNHTKIIIFGAVIFISTALFLLLERFKAKQE